MYTDGLNEVIVKDDVLHPYTCNMIRSYPSYLSGAPVYTPGV